MITDVLHAGFAGLSHSAASITDVSDDWPSLAEVIRVLTFRQGYNTTLVVLGTTLLGLAAGLTGTFALLRKRALMADALSHATLPGIVLMFIVLDRINADAKSLPFLLLGGAATGVFGVWCVHLILRHTRLREDAAIGIVLSCFFGFGIALLSIVPQISHTSPAGLNHFIYGQAAAMNPGDVWLHAAIAVVAFVAVMLLCKEFAIVSFNDAFARATGWPVSLLDLLLMSLVVLVTVAGLQSVGLLLIVAMLIIPPAAARFWSNRLRSVLFFAATFGGLSAYLGATVSALLPRKPAGAVIVLTAGCLFFMSMLIAPNRGVIAHFVRHLRVRARIATDHLVESLLELNADSSRASPESRARQEAEIARSRGWSRIVTRVVIALSRFEGLVTFREDQLMLTRQGRDSGSRIARNHRLWEQYLISFADVAPTHVDWSVDQVEHVLDEPTINELERELRRRGVDLPPRINGEGIE